MANMTRQHYEHLAHVLGEAIARNTAGNDDANTGPNISTHLAYSVARLVAERLEGTNPNYNAGRFMDAVDVAASQILPTLHPAHTDPHDARMIAGAAVLASTLERNGRRIVGVSR
jgi:hypothetical protein